LVFEDGQVSFEEIVFYEVVDDAVEVGGGDGYDLEVWVFLFEEGGHFDGHHYFCLQFLQEGGEILAVEILDGRVGLGLIGGGCFGVGVGVGLGLLLLFPLREGRDSLGVPLFDGVLFGVGFVVADEGVKGEAFFVLLLYGGAEGGGLEGVELGEAGWESGYRSSWVMRCLPRAMAESYLPMRI
jgi:hypothetical protein